MYLSPKGNEIAYKLREEFDEIRREKSVRWSDIFRNEYDLIITLKAVPVINPNEVFLGKYYTGYAYINRLAYILQHGGALTKKQMTQAKKLASEIKIAYEIRNEWR